MVGITKIQTEFSLQFVERRKKIEFSNWISGKRGWQIKIIFLGVKQYSMINLIGCKKGEKKLVGN